MTLEDTRRLGIEFERRVQTMIPEKEIAEKLDTETIYSFLNQYQDKYVHDIYRNLDKVASGSKLSAHVESILQSMLATEEVMIDGNGVNAQDYTTSVTDANDVEIIDTARSVIYKLPENFYMYIRSVSNVTKTFSFKGGSEEVLNKTRVIPNELVSQSDIWRLIETPYDSLRILRYPAASITPYNSDFKKEDGGNPGHYIPDSNSYPTMTVLYDRYTEPKGIKVTYYKQPARFSLMTSTNCELPLDAFDDLVSGAVELYIQYVAGAEANRRRQLEAARKQQQRNNDDNDDRQ